MTTTRTPTPSEFPIMMPARRYRRVFRMRPMAVCRVCHLAMHPRNRRAHERACLRRKRLAPELWNEWKRDMNEGWDR